MGVGVALRELAEFLEECERAGGVSDVALAERIDAAGDGVTADVEVALSPTSGEGAPMSLCATTLNADGTVRLGFETDDPVVPTADHDVDVEPTDATLGSDGTVRVTLSASVPANGASAGDAEAGDPARPADDQFCESADGTPRPTDRDVPPFKDPELLAEVYESCDTFAEMADTLDMDVTSETVRRYMMDYDIHEPNSYDTGGDAAESDANEETPVVLSDGIGLPDDVTVDTLIETVEQSNTIYEVKRDVGVGRQDALEMLQELNLLDLVVGRLATEAERDINRADVVERLRQASAAR
jgi:hypothetical protein